MSNGSRQLEFSLNGRPVSVDDGGATLLEVLRDRLGERSVKDGCSPQGQCGCCTVLVDGQPRVSCVTPARRVVARDVVTVDGLPHAEVWANAFCEAGASQCGFCTPGIIARLAGHQTRKGALDEATIRDALKAHLCRCTGWQTIVEAAVALPGLDPARDLEAASRRATIEGRTAQTVAPAVALGRAGFADDTAPDDALVAVRSGDGTWVVGESLGEARRLAGKVQGRRTTVDAEPPLELPQGDFTRTLRTSWVEPGYLETDAAWCAPGGSPASPLANGGAFGSKADTEVERVARELADRHGRPVRVLASREDVARLGPKRPPIAAGVRADGSGVMRVVRTHGIADAIRSVAPEFDVEEVDAGPVPTSAAVRAAGWAEALILRESVAEGPVTTPDGATASATFDGTSISVTVACGTPLDQVVLRSYCIGAAHMAYSWVTSESLTVDPDAGVLDLTVRSFGIARAVDTPHIEVTIESGDTEPVNGSDAVFVAVAAAVWRHLGHPPAWPASVIGSGARVT